MKHQTLCFCSEPPSDPPTSSAPSRTLEIHLAGLRTLPRCLPPSPSQPSLLLHTNTHLQQVSSCKHRHMHPLRHLCFWRAGGKCHFLSRVQMEAPAVEEKLKTCVGVCMCECGRVIFTMTLEIFRLPPVVYSDNLCLSRFGGPASICPLSVVCCNRTPH